MVAVLGKILATDQQHGSTRGREWTIYKYQIKHPEGTDWMSTFEILSSEMKVDDIYNIEYHTNDRGYKDLDKWERTKFGDEVANTEANAPQEVTVPAHLKTDPNDLPGIVGQEKGHAETMAWDAYIQLEGIHLTDIEEIDIWKIRKMRDRILSELTQIAPKKASYWKFHFCEQHQQHLTEQSPRSGKWYHKVDDDYCMEDGTLVTSAKAVTKPKPEPVPEPEPEPDPAVIDEEELP